MNGSPAAPTSPLRRLPARYVAFVERHTRLVIGLFTALALVAGALAARLELHTDFSELLPDEHPAVVALRTITPRQKSATNLVLLVHSPDRAANHRFAEAIRPALTALVPSLFTEIVWRPDGEIPAFAARNFWLYAERREIEQAEALLDRLITARGSPFAVDIEGDPEAELKRLRDDLKRRQPAPPPSTEWFESRDPDGQWYLGVQLWRRRDGFASRGDYETLQRVQEIVATTAPSRFHPGMAVQFTGHIAMAIDEQNGVRDDLTLATCLVLALVLGSIWLYYRRVALIAVIGAPAVLGVLVSLALASLTIRYLNINTAFLISIILGNGINSPIILLARYGEERGAGRPVAEALATAMSGTLLGTLAAMAAASIAYGSLLLTSFRGFNQFGLLGGAGMLICWLLTFLLVPPLVILGERLWPGRLTPRPNLFRRPFLLLGRLGERRPLLLSTVGLILLGAALPSLLRYLRDPMEWNIERLRTDETPSQKLWGRMEPLGMGQVGAGYIGNNGVLLVDRPEQAEAVAAAMREQDRARGQEHTIAAVRTLASTLPTEQGPKLEILERIRRQLDRQWPRLDEEERRELEAFRPPADLRPLTVDDLPRQIREAFTEVDGQRGRLIGIDADYANYRDWEGHDLIRLSRSLTVEALGKRWTAASAGTVFAGMIETIVADGPRITLAATVGVILLVGFMFGPRGSVPVLLSLAVGLFWWVAVLGRLDLKINFMNFVALPITLGVGADYGANIWARLRDRTSSLAQAVADTGSAVALCSLTTIIGYSSLLLSKNRALRSFGLAADLGEATCLAAALLILPAFVGATRGLFGRGPGEPAP